MAPRQPLATPVGRPLLLPRQLFGADDHVGVQPLRGVAPTPHPAPVTSTDLRSMRAAISPPNTIRCHPLWGPARIGLPAPNGTTFVRGAGDRDLVQRRRLRGVARRARDPAPRARRYSASSGDRGRAGGRRADRRRVGEAIVAATGPWAGELSVEAWHGMRPRWRQRVYTAANRGRAVLKGRAVQLRRLSTATNAPAETRALKACTPADHQGSRLTAAPTTVPTA